MRLAVVFFLFFALFLGNPLSLSAQQRLHIDEVEYLLRESGDLPNLLQSLQKEDYSLLPHYMPLLRKLLWEKYLEEGQEDSLRLAEHEAKALHFGDKTMRFEFQVLGEKPVGGYPLYIALHGGGGTTAEINDSQWRAMQSYYAGSIENGIYVAPRGVTDTWNLHFVSESYPLYDQLIENMILYEGVDPNRVFLMGYSAGGDGVYQISARMPDRFAAVNMSAGHHNNVNPMNLAHLPFLMQVGELDGAYDRNKETVLFAQKLRKLEADNLTMYPWALNVHWGKGHSYVEDHQGAAHLSKIIENPFEWIADSSSKRISTTCTDAVNWMYLRLRQPWMRHIRWHTATRAESRGLAGRQLYGLGIPKGEDFPEEMVVHIVNNTIDIEIWEGVLELSLHEFQVDFSKAILVKDGEKEQMLIPEMSLKVLIETLLEYGDPNLAVPARLLLRKNGAEIEAVWN